MDMECTRFFSMIKTEKENIPQEDQEQSKGGGKEHPPKPIQRELFNNL